MAIINTPAGTLFTGSASIHYFRLCVLRSMLKLEIDGFGPTRGPTAYSKLKKDFGFKGSRQQVLDKVSIVISTMQANPGSVQEEQ